MQFYYFILRIFPNLKYWIRENFELWILTNLHILGIRDLKKSFKKCLSVCDKKKKNIGALSQGLLQSVSSNFSFY